MVIAMFILFITGCVHPPFKAGPLCEIPTEADHKKSAFSWSGFVDGICDISDGAMCKTAIADLAIPQPAEIDLTKYKNIAFANIGGNAGEDFTAAIMEEMVKYDEINVIDRNQLAGHLAELELGQEAIMSPQGQLKIGKMLPGTLLVFGKVDYENTENINFSVNKGNVLTEMLTGRRSYSAESKRTSRAFLKGQLHFTNTETGRQVQVKRLSKSSEDSSSAMWGTTPPANKAEMLDRIIHAAVKNVIRSIIPWKEVRPVIFYKDGNFPKLERGIAEAQTGSLGTAKEIFSEAITDIESSPTFNKKSLAAAKFNLGVIKMYERQYDAANKLLSEVDDIALKEFPAVEMRNINKCLRKNDEKLLKDKERNNITSLSPANPFVC